MALDLAKRQDPCLTSNNIEECRKSRAARASSSQTVDAGAGLAVPSTSANQGGGNDPGQTPVSSVVASTIATTPSSAVAVPTSNAAASTGQKNSGENGGGNGLATGAVAGIAIGTFLVGALLAFIVAFFLFKKRNKNRNANAATGAYTSYADSSPDLVMAQKNNALAGRNSPYVQVSQTPIPAPAPAPAPISAPTPVQDPHLPGTVASFLPPPAYEDTVKSKVAALFEQTHHHVDSYYRDVHASITASMEPDLARFGADEVNMAEILQECSHPTTAIKHALTAYVLGITGPRKRGEGDTMFPAELTSVGSQAHNFAGTDANLIPATTLLRRISVYLFTATSPLTTGRRSHSVQSDIREAAEHFSLTFFPWASPTGSDEDKDEDLARIINEALELRIWLFGQPAEYEFDWAGVGRGGVIVRPGLVRREGEESELVLAKAVSGL